MSEPIRVTPELLRGMPLPVAQGDKERRGRVLVVAGSCQLPGTALLAGVAALRAGAGKLQIATCRSLTPALGVAVPEARVIGLAETEQGGIDAAAGEALAVRAADCAAVLIGPGMMDEPAVLRLAQTILGRTSNLPVVLDGPAMGAVLERPELVARHLDRIVITPHAGEAAHLTGQSRAEIEQDPLSTARRMAVSLGVTVALKGAVTRIAKPDGTVWFNDHGNVGLATSGSGDTLAGIMAGLMARGASADEAAIWAVYLHAKAGDRLAGRVGPIGYLARELPAEIPAILADLAAEAAAEDRS